jgi:hypothetical protein
MSFIIVLTLTEWRVLLGSATSLQTFLVSHQLKGSVNLKGALTEISYLRFWLPEKERSSIYILNFTHHVFLRLRGDSFFMN